jgi:hypothetical protein
MMITPLGGAGVTGAAGSAVAGSPAVAPVASSVPCDVASIIGTHCTACHQTPTKIGAPMPLMTLADFHAAAVSDSSRKVFEVIPERLAPPDPNRRMPQPPLAALSDVDQATLRAWLGAGAPASTDQCPIAVTELPGSTEMPAGMPTLGRAHVEPIEYDDPDMQCYKFLTHARGDKDAPHVQGAGEQYLNFSFAPPWTGTVYLRATKIANDPNSRVLHHWLLFKQSAPVTDGAIAAGSGIHPSGTLIHAWGPGASPIYFDPDVGIPLEDSVGYLLEAHFNNPTGSSGEDHSGAELCVTPHEPEHVAELVWLGSDSIFGTSATGNCRPNGPFPIHVIAGQPHMHKSGIHMKVTVNRAAGPEEVVHDMDFAFENQLYYVENFDLNDGDTVTTTCTYGSPASFGTSTNSEMCYFFSLAWPAGSLRMGGGSLIHGPASCM